MYIDDITLVLSIFIHINKFRIFSFLKLENSDITIMNISYLELLLSLFLKSLNTILSLSLNYCNLFAFKYHFRNLRFDFLINKKPSSHQRKRLHLEIEIIIYLFISLKIPYPFHVKRYTISKIIKFIVSLINANLF